MPTGIGTGLLLSAIIGGGSSIVGGALANKGKSQQSQTPSLDPQFQPLQQMMLESIQKRMQNGGLPAAYETNGIKSINSTFDLAKQNVDNSLTSRGLGQSPVAAAADTKWNTSRAGEIGGFRANLPLVQRQLQNEDFGMAGSLLGQGRGLNITGSSSYGGGAGGAANNLASMMGYLMGQGVFGQFPGGTPRTPGATTYQPIQQGQPLDPRNLPGFLPPGSTY